MPTPTAWIGVLGAVLGLACLGLLLGVLPDLPGVASPVDVSWPLLAVGFFVAEALVVHIQFDRESHSFSLSDIVLVLGLYLADAEWLVVGQLVGVGIALAVVRGQRALKLAFNLAHFGLGTCLAIIVFALLAPPGDPLGPRGWVATVAAVLTATVVSNVCILGAISLSERALRLRRLPDMLAMCVPFAAGTAAFALLGVVGVWHNPITLLLLAVPAALVFAAYRAFQRAREQSENVRLLHDVTRVLYERGDLETALGGFLMATRSAFRVGLAEIVLVGADAEDTPVRSCSAHGLEPVVMEPVRDPEQLRPLLADPASAEAGSGTDVDGVLITRGSGRGHGPLDRYARDHDFKDAMVVRLRSEHRVHGLLLVANRLGEVSTFDESDRQLLATLSHHVSSALENGRLETTLVHVTKLKEQLRHQAFHDPLTGLANRTLYFERVQHAIEAAPRTERWPTVLFLDLDGFKAVNDTLGHDSGDLLLRTVASRLEACLRPGDTAARLGGDEFAAVLEDAGDYAGAVAVAERIHARLSAPFHIDGALIPINVSIGIALGSDHPADAGEITANADSAMYAAKRAGGRRFAFFAASDTRGSPLPARLVRAELEAAVQRGEFTLLFQPLINLSTGTPAGAEALVRWEHPTRGTLAPDEFIPLAEETGLIVEIGVFVLREACRQAAGWVARGPSPGAHSAGQLPAGRLPAGHLPAGHLPAGHMVTVNLSAAQLADPDLHGHVREALVDADLDPARLVLEITETLLMHDRESAEAALWKLKHLGVQIAIDDFGTGYSSLAYLRRFPIDMLKIPREFIDGLGRDPNDDVITRAIIDLAATLGLRSVAEGIETAEQHERVTALNCQLGQGYLFSRPIDAAQVRRYLAGTGDRSAQAALLDTAPVALR